MAGLTYSFDWDSSGESPELARGALTLRLDGQLVWGNQTAAGDVGFSWTWVDLLEHLARVWPRLLRQPLPFGLEPEAVGSFDALARERLAQVDPDGQDEASQAAWDFSEAHDLAHAVPGVRLPSLWLVVEGQRACVATATATQWLPLDASLARVEALGEVIAARLASVAHPRATEARRAWKQRTQSSEDLLELSTGWPSDSIAWVQSLVRQRRGTTQRSVVVALARAVRGVMSPEDLESVVRAVFSGTSAARKHRALAEPPAFEGRPWEQGFSLAQWLRRELELGLSRVEPERVLRSLGVRVARLRLPNSRQVDAVATWTGAQGQSGNRGSRNFG